MEKSIIYDMLNSALFRLRDEIELKEADLFPFIDEKKALEKLEAELNDKQKHLLKLYALSVENKLDYIHSQLEIKILNYGIKAGMEIEKSFSLKE